MESENKVSYWNSANAVATRGISFISFSGTSMHFFPREIAVGHFFSSPRKFFGPLGIPWEDRNPFFLPPPSHRTKYTMGGNSMGGQQWVKNTVGGGHSHYSVLLAGGIDSGFWLLGT